jgi:hypothetical protein
MNNKAVFYCSDLSKNAGEPLYGTASHSKIWILLEHPSPWGRKALVENRLSDAVKAHLKSSLEMIEGSRAQLIRQSYSQTGQINFFLVNARESSPVIHHFKLRDHEELLDLDLAALAESPDPKATEPLYLVCTDGNHDKCCAKYGLRTYKALREKFGDRIWESSHVGGDRFAANLICFPHGLYYGRVSELEAERVVLEHQKGRLFLGNYRGRTSYPKNAQIGEYFLRRQLVDDGLESFRLVEHKALDQDVAEVCFESRKDGALHIIRFLRKDSGLENHMTCTSEEKGCVVEYHLLEHAALQPPPAALAHQSLAAG